MRKANFVCPLWWVFGVLFIFLESLYGQVRENFEENSLPGLALEPKPLANNLDITHPFYPQKERAIRSIPPSWERPIEKIDHLFLETAKYPQLVKGNEDFIFVFQKDRPHEPDREGFISQYSLTGELIEYQFLSQVFFLESFTVFEDTLFLLHQSQLYQIQIANKSLVQKKDLQTILGTDKIIHMQFFEGYLYLVSTKGTLLVISWEQMENNPKSLSSKEAEFSSLDPEKPDLESSKQDLTFYSAHIAFGLNSLQILSADLNTQSFSFFFSILYEALYYQKTSSQLIKLPLFPLNHFTSLFYENLKKRLFYTVWEENKAKGSLQYYDLRLNTQIVIAEFLEIPQNFYLEESTQNAWLSLMHKKGLMLYSY